MIWTLAVILFVAWLLLYAVLHLFGGIVHILLILAVVVVIFRLLSGRRTAV